MSIFRAGRDLLKQPKIDSQMEISSIVETDRGVTLRALTFGVCLSVVVNLLANSVRYIVHGSLMAYSHMPMGNMILYMVCMVICSVLAYGFGRVFVFSKTEWLTIFTMGFVSSIGPTYGISGQLVGAIVAPYYFATPENRWAEFLHPYLPTWIIPNNSNLEMTWFFNGLPAGASMPWSIWAGPLFWWFSFIAAVCLACFCASIIIHRQWSEHEKLVFPAMEPIVEIVSHAGSGARLLPEFMTGRMFWSGFGVTMFIYGWNIIGWFFTSFPQFHMTPGYALPLARNFPALWVSMNTYAICFSYFASLEVLFSLWFFDVVFMVESGVLTRFGLPAFYSYRSAGVYTWQTVGAFVCLVFWWLLISRRHLRDAFWKAVRPDQSTLDDSRELLSYRGAFIGLTVGCLYTMAWLWQAGMDVKVLVVMLPAAFVVYLGMGKILADSGLVFLSSPTSGWGITIAILGGAKAIPAVNHALMYPTSVVLNHFKGFPFTFGMHANRLAEFVRGDKRRLFWGICTAFVVGTVVSTLFVIWLGYDMGAYNFDPNWLITQEGQSGYQRVVSEIVSPQPMQTNEYLFLVIGAAAMAAMVAMRYRFSWWPFHPIGFALSGSALSHLTAVTIFVAWAIKFLLLRFVGASFYRRTRPFFVGMLIGYVTAIGLGLIVDVIYFSPQGHMVHVY